MTPEYGDIVRISSRKNAGKDGGKWVMAPGEGSPTGECYVRLLRPNERGRCETFNTYARDCEVIERPTFAIGDTVSANGGRRAKIIAINGDTIRVRYEPRSRRLGKSGLTFLDTGESDISIWNIVYDNRL